MKAKLAVFALGALVLMANGAAQAVRCTFGTCRAYLGIPMDMPRARRRPEVYSGKPMGMPPASRPPDLYSDRNKGPYLAKHRRRLPGLAPATAGAGLIATELR
jgi:hypothetical protein